MTSVGEPAGTLVHNLWLSVGVDVCGENVAPVDILIAEKCPRSLQSGEFIFGVLFRGVKGCTTPPTTRQPSLAYGCLFRSGSLVDFPGQILSFCSTRCSTKKLNSSLIITI